VHARLGWLSLLFSALLCVLSGCSLWPTDSM
jgi:hypothetical protein